MLLYFCRSSLKNFLASSLTSASVKIKLGLHIQQWASRPSGCSLKHAPSWISLYEILLQKRCRARCCHKWNRRYRLAGENSPGFLKGLHLNLLNLNYHRRCASLHLPAILELSLLQNTGTAWIWTVYCYLKKNLSQESLFLKPSEALDFLLCQFL